MKRKSCWAWAPSINAEQWFGEYATKAQARRGAKDNGIDIADTDNSGWIAPAVWPDVEEIAAAVIDLDTVMEHMDEHAHDDAMYDPDGPIFELKVNAFARPDAAEEVSRALAEDALKAAVALWAKTYLRATAYTVDSSRAERVTPLAEPTPDSSEAQAQGD